MSQRPCCNDRFLEFDIDDAMRVMVVLGPMPRATLDAMADYGMSDAEISRYFRISPETVSALRQHYSRQAASWRAQGQ